MIIEGKFTINAPIKEVWDFLVDIERMSVCMPGVEQVEQADDKKYNGAVTVKVGPISASFKGTVTKTVEEPPRIIRARLQGRDQKTASMVTGEFSSELTPVDSRTTSSRSTYMMGNAVRAAAQDLRSRLLSLAGEYFQTRPEEINLKKGSLWVRGQEDSSLSYAELLQRTGRERLEGSGTHSNPGGLDSETGMGIASSHWHQGAGAVEVEIDPETGKIEIIHCHSCVYAGRVINLSLAELQNEGNMIFGIGSALFEEIVFDEGQVSNPNLSDYLIPSIMDLPLKMTGTLLEVPGAVSHGLGETALPTIPAAVGNAVSSAIGARFYDLPLTPEKVLRALKGL